MFKSQKDVLVSVIMPTFNSEKYLRESIDSILSQTHANLELIITDDCSSDSTWDILTQIMNVDFRVKIFQLDTNSGAGSARNNSILNSNGEFLAFCDSDDIWELNKLEVQINFMLVNKVYFTYSSYTVFGDGIKFQVNPPLELKFEDLRRKNYIGCSTVVIDKSKLGKILMPEFRNRQDWGFWLKVIQEIGIARGIGMSLVKYRIHNNSISKRKFRLIKYHHRVYREILGYNKMKTVYFLIKNLIVELKLKILRF